MSHEFCFLEPGTPLTYQGQDSWLQQYIPNTIGRLKGYQAKNAKSMAYDLGLLQNS